MDENATHMQRPVRDYATRDFVQLRENMRVDEALKVIRDRRSTGNALIYFYVVDANEKLIGVPANLSTALRCATPTKRR